MKKVVKSVFEDLFKDENVARNLEMRAFLMMEIEKFIKENDMTQKQAARALGVSPARVSSLLHRHIDKFSVDRLIGIVANIGKTVNMRLIDNGKAGGRRGGKAA